MNLFREVTLDELEQELKKEIQCVSCFMKEKSKQFINLMISNRYEEAINLAFEEIGFGYHYLIRSLKGHLEAKERILKGEKIYTTLVSKHVD